MSYSGPIIDAHHHLWDLSLGRHPWITGAGVAALGDVAYLRRDYGLAELRADMEGQGVVGSVHVEALWDRARDPVEETRWLEGLARPVGLPPGIAARYVASVPLGRPGAAEILSRQLAASPRVVGLRETVRWHPDPARRWTDRDWLNDPDWCRDLRLLRPPSCSNDGLLLELLMNPYQAADLARLAAAEPDQIFVVNHCASPVDRDAAGLARWLAGLDAMAARPNIAIKLSNASAYSAGTSTEALAAVVAPILERFGPARCLFGTDYPVARRTMRYHEICDAMRAILAPLTPAEQRAVFHDNAARLYRFPRQD